MNLIIGLFGSIVGVGIVLLIEQVIKQKSINHLSRSHKKMKEIWEKHGYPTNTFN